jgi:ribose 5-phosphate isomerase B
MAAADIYIASDHAGFLLKTHFLKKYSSLVSSPVSSLAWHDLGPASEERVDYPDFAGRLAQALLINPLALGVLICGSGQGMCMSANRFKHIRAALAWSPEVAVLAREHNDANVLCLGSRVTAEPLCETILETFLATPFAGGRHQDRVKKMSLL